MTLIKQIGTTISAILLTGLTAGAVTIPVDEDTTTTPALSVTTTAGKSSTLLVQPTRDALVRFDLTNVPSNYNYSTLRSARLRIYVARVAKAGDLAVHAVTQSWSESIRGDAPPIDATPITTVPSANLKSKRFVVVDITETARTWLQTPGLNFGIALIAGGADPTAKLTLAAKEGPGIGPAAELELEADTQGGTMNTLGPLTSVISGGEQNTIALDADYSTIPGGFSNEIGADADFSLAAGRRARVIHDGSFVWADSTNADFSSTADNQFAIRAANGLYIANDAGGAKVVPIGTRYRDNAIVAWGRVTAAGGLDTNFNVASVTRLAPGVYNIVLNSSLSSGFSLVPAITPEIDGPGGVVPTGAAAVRIPAADMVAAGNNFSVYMYNGSFNLVDNDFQFVVTGR